MADKREQMLTFWSERALQYRDDPRANTNDIHLRELEISFIDRLLADERPRSVLDFGCANGYSTIELGRRHPGTTFVGVDINADMIAAADAAARSTALPNVSFRQVDVLADPLDGRFDFICGIRVFQNIESFDLQCRVADRLLDGLDPAGLFVYIESYAAEYEQLNRDRVALNLDPLPIHAHLTLLTPDFDDHIGRRLDRVARHSLSSSYYLITRLAYSAMAKELGEPIDYDHPLHRLAARVPQLGEYGPQFACVFRRA